MAGDLSSSRGAWRIMPGMPLASLPARDARVDVHADPLWAAFVALLKTAAAVFGPPGEIAEQGWLSRSAARLLAGWLRALEAMARALLVRLAAEVPAPAAQPSVRSRASAESSGDLEVDPGTDEAARPIESDPWDSSRWIGASLRMTPSEGGARGPQPAGPAWPLAPARALAVRFEALIRIAEAPRRHAARLAIRLRRSREPLRRMLRPPVLGDRHVDLSEDVAEAQRQAWRAWPPPRSDDARARAP